MAQKSVSLCANVNSGAPSDQAAVLYQGGRGVLLVEATTYPTQCQLQMQSISGKWVNVGSNIAADGIQALDMPQGQYRLHMSGGVVAALYANLVSVMYV